MIIAEYLAIQENNRPIVYFHGHKVAEIYRDPAYGDEERYVIRFGNYGVGSKRPGTTLETEEEFLAS